MLEVISKTKRSITFRASNGFGALVVLEPDGSYSIRLINRKNELFGEPIWGLTCDKVKKALAMIARA